MIVPKSETRKKQEKAIMDKIQSIFDNAEIIDNFDISIHGACAEVTTIQYRVEERIIPKEEGESR